MLSSPTQPLDDTFENTNYLKFSDIEVDPSYKYKLFR